MARIYDLTDEDSGGGVLTGASGGLLSSTYLADDPPAAYLAEHERPQYVLRNKTTGVTVGGASDGIVAPDDDHQALAVVTDVRVCFIVGAADGDAVRSVSLDGVVTADAESTGFLTSELRIETLDGDVWRFPVRGDASEVAAYVDDAAQTWANASRLVEEARDRVDRSRTYLDQGAFDAARAVLDDVADDLATARERVEALGAGARAALDDRVGVLPDRLGQLRREIAAMKGARHHADAQSAWKDDHDFEAAASHYDVAITEYRRGLAADGQTPPDASLRGRFEGAVREREILTAAPMADAKAAREAALATEDPEAAATEWETALTCYREAVALDWGEEEREFAVRRDLARERAAEATDRAIDAHVEAGEEWLAAADRIAAGGSRAAARQAYERARDHFAAARNIARDLRQGRVEGLDERLSTVDDRLHRGVVPAIVPRQTALSVGAVTDVLDADTAEQSAGSMPDDRTGGDSGTGIQSEVSAGSATGAATEGIDGEFDPLAAVRALDERAVTTLVADVLAEDGWATTVFGSTNATVYDIVAIRDGRRRLVWTVHRPDGGAVGATAIRRCATARDRSQGTDRASLVTTGTLTPTARERATDLGVTAIDGQRLVERLRAADLLDRLR